MGEFALHEVVSKVTIDAAHLQSPLLTRKKKRQLRIDAIKAYIENKPHGKRIKISEFQAVGHFGTTANTYAFVEKLVKKNIINKHEISQRTFYYTVPGPMKVRTLEGMKAEPAMIYDVPKPDVIIGERQYSVAQLNTEAMKYFWAYDDTSIKGFINWLKSQED